MTDLEWTEMASVRFWSRVYEVRAQTGCTLEDAIKAVLAADQENRARTV